MAQEVQRTIETATHFHRCYNLAVVKLDAALPALLAALDSQGLQMSELSYYPTGMHNERVWKEGTSLAVSIKARRKDGSKKFRFIGFNGYDSRGAGKNQERLDAKAHALREVLNAGSVLEYGVNCFSLEIKDDANEDTNQVLISTHVHI